MPRRVKKRRKIQSEDGSDQGWEEYFEYIFPEDEADKPNLKLLAMAKMWKKNKEQVSYCNRYIITQMLLQIFIYYYKGMIKAV